MFQTFSGVYEPQPGDDLDDMVAVANRVDNAEQEQLREADRERDAELRRDEPVVVNAEELPAEGWPNNRRPSRIRDRKKYFAEVRRRYNRARARERYEQLQEDEEYYEGWLQRQRQQHRQEPRNVIPDGFFGTAETETHTNRDRQDEPRQNIEDMRDVLNRRREREAAFPAREEAREEDSRGKAKKLKRNNREEDRSVEERWQAGLNEDEDIILEEPTPSQNNPPQDNPANAEEATSSTLEISLNEQRDQLISDMRMRQYVKSLVEELGKALRREIGELLGPRE